MKHTKRKYNKTHRNKKRNQKKTKKIIFVNKKTRKQRGSGKYPSSDVYGIDQFITNDCLNVLKRELKPSEKGIFTKLLKSKKDDPYVKCRRSMRILNSEKMSPDNYLKYREIIKVSKNDPYYSNPDRGNIEDIGNKYIFDYVFTLYNRNKKSELIELLKVISPCYLIYLLTFKNYQKFINHLAEKSEKKRSEGKLSSLTINAKTNIDIVKIYNWVKDTNLELFKLKTPLEFVNLFNSYYPINCPYNEKLKQFERINIKATQMSETNTRYTNSLSWDLYLYITFSNFYNDYFSKGTYDTSIVYSSLIGESFIRRLSTNIIDKNGEIIFKSTDGDGDFYEYNKSNLLFNKEDFTKKHFNKFIQKLNEIGGTNKFDDTKISYEDKTTTVDKELPDRLIGTLNYNTVISNLFIENIIKFLAIAMMPIIINVTRVVLGGRNNNYYGLFYHYFEEKYDGDCYFLYNNINERNNIPVTNTETEIINLFIKSNIPNDNYNKCVEDLRKNYSSNLFPDSRIVDIQNNKLYCFSHTLITLPFDPFPVVGRYIQIMKFDNILRDSVNDVTVTVNSIILWNGNINKLTITDVFSEELSQFKEQEVKLGDVIQTNVGDTFYKGFLEPILSSLKPDARIQTDSPVNSQNTTPRNSLEQNNVPIRGISRDSLNSNISDTVEL